MVAKSKLPKPKLGSKYSLYFYQQIIQNINVSEFAKPKQMKQADYNSSSDDEDQELLADPKLDDHRLSDCSDYNLSDDDAAAIEAGEEIEDVKFDDESEDDEDGAINESSLDEEDTGNAGWAKSLATILNQEKPKNKKSVVLSKAKKLVDILDARKKAKDIGFAIEGEVKEEKPDVDDLDHQVATKKKSKSISTLRIKPTMMDRERERAFKKIATKGVVQLFNAVRTQQKDLVQKLDAAGRLDHKRDAVLNNINKRKFLDVLMGGARAKSENVDHPVKDEDSDMNDEVYNDGLPKNSIWSVLK